MHFHILGVGAIGCHMATMLRMHQHTVTLLMKTKQRVEQFNAHQQTIVYTQENKTQRISGFETGLTTPCSLEKTTEAPIDILITCTKAHHIRDAIKPLIPRLTKDSTVVLLHNGMGVAEELMGSVWKNQSPPTVLVGVNQHGVERTGPFQITNHGGWEDPQALGISVYPHTSGTEKTLTIIEALTRIKPLSAVSLPWEELVKKMATKLVINACINPVATLLNCKNRYLIENNPHAERIMFSVCEEAMSVLGPMFPGETVDSLYATVRHVNHIRGNNTCSMLQDIHAKSTTEVDYINGYLCRLGIDQKKPTPTNQALVNFIHAKTTLVSK
ncbi:ketopantoate reductase PanE/ApbA-domain-containing protein [Spinellus fusiger]|nr:ketopantoate reductase PanE/ApbA-domain-containing protein [Spinellus fusiger]